MSTAEQTSSPFADPILTSVETVEQTTINAEPVVSGPELPDAGQHLSSASVRLTEVMIQARELMKKSLEEVAKPSVTSFLETCNSNPKLAAVIAAPAILGLALVALFFVISVVVLSVWTLSTILVSILVVIVGGLLSLLLKLIMVTAAALPLAAMATGFFVVTVTFFEFLMSPATTLLWVARSVTRQTTDEAIEPQPSETASGAPQQSTTSPPSPQASGHESAYSNLVATANVAWDSTVILGSFLKWTSQQLWFVGTRAYTEIKHNIDEARARQAQSEVQAQAISPRIVPEEEEHQVVEPTVSTIPPASGSISVEKTNLTQRPSHSRGRDDVDEE